MEGLKNSTTYQIFSITIMKSFWLGLAAWGLITGIKLLHTYKQEHTLSEKQIGNTIHDFYLFKSSLSTPQSCHVSSESWQTEKLCLL